MESSGDKSKTPNGDKSKRLNGYGSPYFPYRRSPLGNGSGELKTGGEGGTPPGTDELKRIVLKQQFDRKMAPTLEKINQLRGALEKKGQEFVLVSDRVTKFGSNLTNFASEVEGFGKMVDPFETDMTQFKNKIVEPMKKPDNVSEEEWEKKLAVFWNGKVAAWKGLTEGLTRSKSGWGSKISEWNNKILSCKKEKKAWEAKITELGELLETGNACVRTMTVAISKGNEKELSQKLESVETYLGTFGKELLALEEGLSPSESRLSAAKAEFSPAKAGLFPVKAGLFPVKEEEEEEKLSPSESRLSAAKAEFSPAKAGLFPVKEKLSPKEEVSAANAKLSAAKKEFSAAKEELTGEEASGLSGYSYYTNG